MTAPQSIHSDSADDLAALIATYRRLAAMDLPALQSLAVGKGRSLSPESR